jgi:hypothetical protein
MSQKGCGEERTECRKEEKKWYRYTVFTHIIYTPSLLDNKKYVHCNLDATINL